MSTNPTPALSMPAGVKLALALLAGVAAVLNQTVFHVGSHWYAAITVGLVFFAGIGIEPLVGSAFAAALKLPSWALALLHATLAAATLALTLIDMSQAVKATIAAVLTIIAGLGFPNTAAKRAV